MSYVLCIDSSTTHASVALAKDEQLLSLSTSNNQKDHAGFLQPAIKQILQEADLRMANVAAVAVTSGPGSYTGLRVGLSTAKGLCYAAGIPLITMHTTLVMAYAAAKQINQDKPIKENCYLCPMIDARRMEVFTAVYDEHLQEIKPPQSLVLDTQLPWNELPQKPFYYFGSGAAKISSLPVQPLGKIMNLVWNAGDMMSIAFAKLTAKQFSSLAYSAPDYLKNFYGSIH